MRCYIRILLAAGMAFLAVFPAQAQDQQVWTTIGASGKIADHVDLSLEALGRFGNDADGLYEAEFGGFVGYELPSGVEIAVGYVRVPGYSNGTVTKKEHRLRQQIGAPLAKIGAGRLSGRIRLEERFRDSGRDTGLRLRPQIKFSLPLENTKTALSFSHESFFELNDTDWGQRSGYRRMRNAVAIKTPLFATVTGEIGYLNQVDFGAGGAGDRMAHIATVALAYGF